jgi:hypothetical protein
MGGETVGATFIWDTTNGTLSNVTLTATGTYWQGTDSATVYGGGITGTSLGIVDLRNAAGDDLQLNYGDHDFTIKPEITSVPGTYLTDLYFMCLQCAFGDYAHNPGGIDPAEIGTATVTSLGDGDHDGDDPVSTPEPNTLILLCAGIGALALITYRQLIQ